jgi:iron complex outermembrane receptor protein
VLTFPAVALRPQAKKGAQNALAGRDTMKGRNITLLVGVAALGTALTSPAWAQDGADDEIIVTAQKREQALQDVPLAISAFTADTIEELGLSSSEELAAFTPNMTYQPAGGIGSSIGLRGIIDSNFTFNQVGSTAVVVDEVALNSPNLNTFALFDLQRIEVLRGPQVTLYGRSTTAGAMNVTTRHADVSAGSNAQVSGGFGDFGLIDFQGAAGLNLSENLAVRIAAQSQLRDGIQANQSVGGDDGDRDRYAIRGSLAWEPTANLSALLTGLHGRDDGEQPRYLPIGFLQPGGGVAPCADPSRQPGANCADPYGFVSPGNFDHSYSNFPSYAHSEVDGGSLNVSWDIGDFELSSITSVIEHSISRQEDTDAGPIGRAEVHNDVATRQESQEFRIATTGDGALNFVGGVFLFNETNDGTVARSILTAGNGSPPIGLNSLLFSQENEIRSAYGQLDWALNDQFAFVLGVRYSDESKEGRARSLRRTGGGAGSWTNFAPANGVHLDAPLLLSLSNAAQSSAFVPFAQSWQDWGGKIGINWTPNSDTLIYASYSQGFKGGTFNLVPAANLSTPAPLANLQAGVDPETVDTYEIGAKLEFFDRSLRLNVAAFMNDYTNQQVFTFIGGAAALFNAGEASIDGLEAELTWTPNEDWLIQASLGLLDATYDEFVLPDPDGDGIPNPTSYAGNRTPYTPEVSWTGLVQRTWQVGENALRAQASVRNQSEQFASYTEGVNVFLPERTTYDARFSFLFGPDQSFGLALWGKNLTDERYCLSIQPSAFTNQCIVNEPRTYGVRLGFDF